LKFHATEITVTPPFHNTFSIINNIIAFLTTSNHPTGALRKQKSSLTAGSKIMSVSCQWFVLIHFVCSARTQNTPKKEIINNDFRLQAK